MGRSSPGMWLLTGLWAGTGLVLGRWLSMEPFSSVFTPWDLAAGALAAALGVGLARGFSQLSAAPLQLLAVGLPMAAAWASQLGFPAIGLGWRLMAGTLAGLAVANLGLAAVARRRVAPADWCAPGLVLAFVLGLLLTRRSGAGLWVLPLAGLLVGLPIRLPLRLPALVSTTAALLLVFATTQGDWPRSRAHLRIAPAPAARAGPGVVLVVLDTLRRDHLALYGYARDSMPALGRFAENALVFDAAWATSSWTLPSHASMFTGLPPRSHGAHGYRGDARSGNAYPLPAELETLAERARAGGVRTGAVVANHFYLSPRYGLDAGFETYWVPSPRRGLVVPGLDALVEHLDPEGVGRVRWPYYRAHEITDRALQWLAARGDRSFFLFVNYMDAHAPNRAPPTAALPLEEELTPAQAGFEIERVMEGEPLPPAVLRHELNEYDRELARLDGELARLLETLGSEPFAGRTTVIVTADHGEHFGEHDLVDHSRDLWEESLAVPLLIAGPGIEAGRRAQPVSILGLHATVLEQLGLSAEPGSILGPPPSVVVAEWYASEHSAHLDPRYRGRFDRDLRVYREGAYKLYRDGRGAVALYDLTRDPAEADDLAASRPAVRRRLERGLDAWLAAHPPPVRVREGGGAAPIDQEQLEQLRALGYAD